MTRASVLIASTALASFACGSLKVASVRDKVPLHGPGFVIDYAASELSMRAPDNGRDAEGWKKFVAEKLAAAFPPPAAGAQAVPLRFKARIEQMNAYGLWASCYIVTVLIGCPVGQHSVTVKIDLQSTKEAQSMRLWHGEGGDSQIFGLYYSANDDELTEAALARALTDMSEFDANGKKVSP